MTVLIITSDLQKGSSSKSKQKLKDTLHCWFDCDEVQLDPSVFLIIAGNTQHNYTQQFISMFEMIATTIKRFNLKNMKVLWTRGNRDYWTPRTQHLQLHLKQQECIKILHKNDAIFENFIHLSNNYPIITHDGVWISGFDDWFDTTPLLSSDLDNLPREHKGRPVHEWLEQRKKHHIEIFLKHLKESHVNPKVKKRICVSHFPYTDEILENPPNNNFCTHEDFKFICQQIDAWVFGHTGEFCQQSIGRVTFLNAGSTPEKPHAIILKL